MEGEGALIRLIRFVKGYVVVDAKGMRVERLLTICARNGIEVWQIEYLNPYCIRFSIGLRDYVKIRKYAVRLGIKMKHASRHGLAFVLRNWQNKVAFILAVCVLSVLVMYVHNHVWSFTFEGNEKITDSMMEAFFTEHNILKGSRIKDIDFSQVEKEFRDAFPEVTWVSMGMDRTSFTVRIVEEVVPFLPMEQQFDASSLYSAEEAVVLDLIVREGKANVKPKAHVYPGELLVSGMLQYTDNNGTDVHTTYLNADADIVLLYRKEFQYNTNSGNLWYECKDPLCEYIKKLEAEGLTAKVIKNRKEQTEGSPYTDWQSEIMISGGGVLRKEVIAPGTDTGEELAYE